jgi:mediator of RNA polymerase II transcription subunit 14
MDGSSCSAEFLRKLNCPCVDNTNALRVHLCADEVVIVTIDPRTGRLNLRDTGDLAATGRGPRFAVISEKLNENPTVLLDALIRLRLNVR